MSDFLAQAWPFAAAVLVILGIVVLVLIIKILMSADKTMKSVQVMAAEAEKEVTPALQKVNPLVDKAELTIDTLNLEMLRVDAILEDVEQVSNVAGKAAETVDNVTTAPAELVGSFVDNVRGVFGGKRKDKVKQGRVVYPIGAGSTTESTPATKGKPTVDDADLKKEAEALASKVASKPEAAPKAAPAAEPVDPDALSISFEGKQAAQNNAAESVSYSDDNPAPYVGKHSTNKPESSEEPLKHAAE